MENLHKEVLTEILIRLPAKQLAQMRCVSKPLNALLSQPLFIKSHLRHSTHSIHNNDELLLLIHSRFCLPGGKPISAHPSRSPHLENHNFIKLPTTLNIPPKYTRTSVIGSVNGLICFVSGAALGYGRDPLIYIWNPSLSAVRALPPFTVPATLDQDGVLDLHFGFGFDPNTDDYKVVKFSRLFRPWSLTQSASDSLFLGWLEVEVYSMRKGSWNLISDRFPSHVDFILDDSLLSITGVDGHDGHLHWLCYDGQATDQVIVAFDLGMESFREISLPDSVAQHKTDRMNVLGVLAGKICMMSSAKNGYFEVWVMGEYGVAESWVRHHVFSQFSGIVPIGFTVNNEFLLRGIDNNCLALYDQDAAKVKSFKVMVPSRYSFDRVKIVPYVDSLVWITPAN